MRSPVRIAALLTVFVAGGASPAAAQVAPDLDGEFLDARTVPSATVEEIERSCDPDGNASLTVRATGVATGPYPGTFEETFRIELGPRTLPPVDSSRPVTDLEATFTIDSPTGQVEGTKLFTPGTVASGECTNQPRFPNDPSGVFLRASGGGFGYEATITTPTCTFVDRGTGGFSVFATTDPLVSILDNFDEGFFTDGSPPQGVGPGCEGGGGDDDDDD